MQGVNLDSMNTLGGDMVLLRGFGFGPYTGSGIAGNSSWATAFYTNDNLEGFARGPFQAECYVVDAWDMNCTTANGIGYNHSWWVELGGQPSDKGWLEETSTSYAPPRLLGLNDEAYSVGFDTRGGQQVVMFGESLGPADSSNIVSAFYGPESSPLCNAASSDLSDCRYEARRCMVTKSQSEVSCTF